MKTLLLYIGIVILLVSCTRNAFRIESGDLLFQVNKSSDLTDAITQVTSSVDNLNLSHVAIALREQGQDFALEASSDGGVQQIPLSQFLNASAQIGGHPAVVVARLKIKTDLAASLARAKQFLGQPYDWSYRPNNGKMYCSELIYESYHDSCGISLFTARPMTFRNAQGVTAPFWVEHFAKLGEPIPEGILGTNPGDLSKESVLEIVHTYFDPIKSKSPKRFRK